MKKTNSIACIKIGPTNIFLLKSNNGYLLIDTSYSNKYKEFLKKLKNLRISVSEIKYCLLTHFHSDHVGFARKLKEDSGCNFILHKNSVPFVENGGKGDLKLLKSGKVFTETLFYLYMKINHISQKYPPLGIGKNDTIIKEDDNKTLRKIGIDGEILYTPGHTEGCISVLMDDGRIIAGDLVMNIGNTFHKDYRPIVAEDYNALYKSWNKILKSGAQEIYPSHGKKLSAHELEKQLELYSNS